MGELSNRYLTTYYQNGTILPAHPAPNKHKGIPFVTGLLGYELSTSAVIFQTDKLLSDDFWVFVLVSDGETSEGTTSEAAHFAVQNVLDNRIVLINKNGLHGFD